MGKYRLKTPEISFQFVLIYIAAIFLMVLDGIFRVDYLISAQLPFFYNHQKYFHFFRFYLYCNLPCRGYSMADGKRVYCFC